MPAKVCVEFTEGDGSENPQPAIRTYAATIGDGSSLSYTVNHGLNTTDVLYTVRNVASGVLDGEDVTVTASANSLSLVFATAPAANGVRVFVAAA